MSKPHCLKSQKIYEVTCVFNSWCNFYELPKLTEKAWAADFKKYWKSLPSTKALSKEQRHSRLRNMIGNQGYTTDVLKMQLRNHGQTFLEKHNIPSANFPDFVKNIDNGFISISVKKPFAFQHCMCVKDGFLIDSIGCHVYPWRGKISFYNEYSFVSAIDLDQLTEHQAVQVSAITLIDSDED